MATLPEMIQIVLPLTGPQLLGQLFNYALFGVLAMQVYLYTITFPRDNPKVKALVYVIFLLDISQTALSTHYSWWVLAGGWGNPTQALTLPWSFATVAPIGATIALMVQLFFAWRIRALGNQRKSYIPVIVVIILASIASCISIFHGTITATRRKDLRKGRVDSQMLVCTVYPRLDLILKLQSMQAWLISSIIADATITTTLVYQLSTRRATGNELTNNIIHRAIRMSIETGLITCLLAVIELILYFHAPPWSFIPGVIIGKVYSNSLLATLNSRSPLFKGWAADSLSGGPVQVWKNRDVEFAVNTDEGAPTRVQVEVDRKISMDWNGKAQALPVAVVL
ncbi:hypothetical protein H0H81_001776 [Sphagnurus paluster]|uniref:DUF6534 domain-containing protein n=1 Tax=Sphagnurus paluster TaxID=117069 RepID=A0A9P7FPD0_9AGAR|nr:hypothetical protein H0H81_001776 [Sphagnurus paluster]